MDKSFVLLIFKVGSLAIFTVLLLIASNFLLLLDSRIEHFSNQQASVQVSSSFSRINQIYFGLMVMFFISTLGGAVSSNFSRLFSGYNFLYNFSFSWH